VKVPLTQHRDAGERLIPRSVSHFAPGRFKVSFQSERRSLIHHTDCGMCTFDVATGGLNEVS
jgi:hypothetical protein